MNDTKKMFARLLGRIFRKKVKIALLGLALSGKTTLLYQLTTRSFVRAPSTFGFNKETLVRNGLEADIIDVGGDDKLIPLWRHYLNDVSAVMYVIDVSDYKRFEQNYKMLKELSQYPEIEKLPLLILLNKTDILSFAEKTSVFLNEYEEKLRSVASHTVETDVQRVCARTGDGIDEAMHWICAKLGSVSARRMLRRIAAETLTAERLLQDEEKERADLGMMIAALPNEQEQGACGEVDESGIVFAESLAKIEDFFQMQFREPSTTSMSEETRRRTNSSLRLRNFFKRLSGMRTHRSDDDDVSLISRNEEAQSSTSMSQQPVLLGSEKRENERKGKDLSPRKADKLQNPVSQRKSKKSSVVSRFFNQLRKRINGF